MSAASVPDPAPPPLPSRALSVNLTVRTMLLVAAIVGLAWAFVYIREAVMTLFLALFGALVLEPVIRLMQRHTRLGRGACATTLILGLIAARRIVFVLLLLAPLAGSFRDFVDALPGHGRGHHEQLVRRLVARRAQLGARDGTGQREGDRAGHRRCRRRRHR